MKVSSNVKMNVPRMKQLTKAATVALAQTAEALHTEVVQAQVVPRDQGTLQNEAMFVDTENLEEGSVTMSHSTPYARKMYYHPEYDFQKTENPNAQGEWFETWISGKEKDFCHKTYKELYKRLGGV